MSTGDVKNVRNAKKQKTNLCINSCFLAAKLTLCSELFSYPTKKEGKNVRNAKNKRQIETNLCINRCFYSSELTLSLGRRDLSGRFLVHICVFYSSYSSHFAFLCTSSKFFRAKMEPDILLKIYVIIMNSHIKNT